MTQTTPGDPPQHPWTMWVENGGQGSVWGRSAARGGGQIGIVLQEDSASTRVNPLPTPEDSRARRPSVRLLRTAAVSPHEGLRGIPWVSQDRTGPGYNAYYVHLSRVTRFFNFFGAERQSRQKLGISTKNAKH